MRRNLFGMIAALVLAALAAAPAAAQETATPNFKAPYRAFNDYEFGADLSFPEGTDFGLEGFYTYGSGPNDFGFRGGIVRGGDATVFTLGGNFRTRVISYSEKFPLDGALTLGIGGWFGSDINDFLVIPVGISLGRRFRLEGSSTQFTPYVHPVLVPELGTGDDKVEFALGLGVDVRFSRNLTARVSGGIGEPLKGVGLGLAFTR